MSRPAIEILCEIWPSNRMGVSVDTAAAVKGSLAIVAQNHKQQKVDQLRLRKKGGPSGFLRMENWSRAGIGHSAPSSELGSSSSGRSTMQKQNGESWIGFEKPGTIMAGCACPRVGWMNIFCRMKARWKKMVMNMSRPSAAQKFQYDAFSYAQNFDDGCWHHDPDAHSFSFSSRLASARPPQPLADGV